MASLFSLGRSHRNPTHVIRKRSPYYVENNWCDAKGAIALKKRIEEYWRVRGCSVEVRTHDEGFCPQSRGCLVTIRSNMVNGMPR